MATTGKRNILAKQQIVY